MSNPLERIPFEQPSEGVRVLRIGVERLEFVLGDLERVVETRGMLGHEGAG